MSYTTKTWYTKARSKPLPESTASQNGLIPLPLQPNDDLVSFVSLNFPLPVGKHSAGAQSSFEVSQHLLALTPRNTGRKPPSLS